MTERQMRLLRAVHERLQVSPDPDGVRDILLQEVTRCVGGRQGAFLARASDRAFRLEATRGYVLRTPPAEIPHEWLPEPGGKSPRRVGRLDPRLARLLVASEEACHVELALRSSDGTLVGLVLAEVPEGSDATLGVGEAHFLEVLAATGVIALRRLTALTEADAVRHRMRSVAAFLDIVSAEPPGLEFVREGLERLIEITGLESGLLLGSREGRFVVEEAGGRLPPPVRGDRPPPEGGAPAGQGPSRQATGLPRLAPADVTARLGLGTALHEVLRVGGAERGLLLLGDRRPDRASGDAAPLLALLARRWEQVHEHHEQASVQERERGRVLRVLARSVEFSPTERGHTDQVVELALRFGAHLGLPADELDDLRWGSEAHDIGKIRTVRTLWTKRGALSAQEWKVVFRHPVDGEELLRELGCVSEGSLRVVRHHHERWDGSGYPDGLRGEQIPRLARLFTIVDVYHALANERPYKRAWGREKALLELERQAGIQTDPEATRAFVQMCGRGGP